VLLVHARRAPRGVAARGRDQWRVTWRSSRFIRKAKAAMTSRRRPRSAYAVTWNHCSATVIRGQTSYNIAGAAGTGRGRRFFAPLGVGGGHVTIAQKFSGIRGGGDSGSGGSGRGAGLSGRQPGRPRPGRPAEPELPGGSLPRPNPRDLLAANQKSAQKDVARLSEIVQQMQSNWKTRAPRMFCLWMCCAKPTKLKSWPGTFVRWCAANGRFGNPGLLSPTGLLHYIA